jgi:transcriptional regulator with XRE-family HTH domain
MRRRAIASLSAATVANFSYTENPNLNYPRWISRLELIAFLNGETRKAIATNCHTSESTISRVMNGIENPSDSLRARLCAYFNSDDELFDKLDRVKVLAATTKAKAVK